MDSRLLSQDRTLRALTVGVAASIGLYFLAATIAEPLRGFAQTSENNTVEVTVASGISLRCDGDSNTPNGSGTTLSLGTITFTGDTGVYADSRAVRCHVYTNNITGYTLGWRVLSGSGGTSTGHMISQFEDIIQAFGTGSASDNTADWSVASTDSRWGGRVSSTSSGSDVAPMLWGTDGASEKWARVKTGSTLTIRASSTNSQGGSGDLIKIGFRAEIGALKSQPTGTYQSTVTFTAAAQ